MNKEDIIRKLTSRKLWLALAAFVSGILTALGHKDTAVTVTGLIMQGAAVISYIIAEGLIDAANKPSDSGESDPIKAESDEEADCPVTVLAYDDYDEDGSPVVDNDFPEEGEDADCDKCDLSAYVDGGEKDGGNA
jgi:hypothetical protein